ncbi:uncharacterized protein [Ptychodera flava]|uniref:uncharacterized protein isoform X1 n=1 Tax=Ptychodera flava TaxID=63121 RepID=UPI00396A01A5
MGGAQTRERSVDSSQDSPVRVQREDWLNVFQIPEENFTYEASNSYAVCAGVGKQLYQTAGSLGFTADNDASIILETLTRHLQFPTNHISLFTSRTTPATRRNVKAALQTYARKVQPDGVLVFHFSGHCTTNRGQSVLVPADYNKTTESVISALDLNEVLKDTRAKYFILTLDCCYAGKFTHDLLFESTADVPMYVLASCSTMEKSMSYDDLGNGFFTFFVNRYLCEKTPPGEFPGGRCVDFCKTLVEAMITLMRPYCDYVMTPVGAFKRNEKMESTLRTYAGDVVDAAQMWAGPSYLSKMFHKGITPRMPDSLCDWLQYQAEPALRVLQSHGILAPREKLVYNIVLTFLSKSTAVILCYSEDEISTIDVLSRRNTFLLCYLLICKILYGINESGDLVPKLNHLESCLENYIEIVGFLKQVSLEDKVFDDIIRFLAKVKRKNKRSKKAAASTGTDEVDKGPITGSTDEVDSGPTDSDEDDSEFVSREKEDTLQMLRSLPGFQGIPQLPSIE